MQVTLHKFCPYSVFTLEMLDTRTFWLALPSAFNDPFDCKYTLQTNLTDAELQSLMQKFALAHLKLATATAGITAAQRQDYIDKLTETHKQMYEDAGLTCFSRWWHSNLMWSHYADKHQGLCLTFSVDSDLVRNGLTLAWVNYTANYPIVHLRDLVSNLGASSYKALFTKSPQWRYEREWRLVSQTGNHKVPWGPFALTEVIFGHRLRDSSKALLKSLLRGTSTKVYAAELAPDAYKIGRAIA